MFAKVEPGAYTEEAIAASKAANGHANGDAHKASNGIGNASGDPQRGVDGMNPGIDKHKKGQKVRGMWRPGTAGSNCVLPVMTTLTSR